MSEGNPVVVEAIRSLLRAEGIEFREVRHPPTLTSEDSAFARGEELRIGGKALLMNGDGVFRLFVLPADRKVDSAAIRKRLGLKKLRFASADELTTLTGLVPGSVPPFGEPVLPFPLFLDTAIQENDRIAFNAGLLTHSIIVGLEGYLKAARPSESFAFSVPPEGS